MAALSGLLAAAAALGVTELVAGAVDSTRSLVLGVGDYVIDQVPGWLERQAIATLWVPETRSSLFTLRSGTRG